MTFSKGGIRGGENGQILLIVVLTMIVALTVGLSIAARVVTELKLSKQNEQSQRAFQAAESGIQQTIERGSGIGSLNSPITLDNSAAFSTTYTTDNGSAIVVNNGQPVDQASGADVWLSDYSANQADLFKNTMGGGSSVAITLYWGGVNQDSCLSSSGDNVAPAIEVVLLQGTVANPTIAKNIYEASGCSRIAGATVGTSVGGPFTLKGVTFKNSASLTFGGSPLANGLIMKVIPIFNSGVIGLQSAGITFPAQGSIVTSTGTSGDTVRKVVYFQSYPQLPLEIFPYSLLSQ